MDAVPGQALGQEGGGKERPAGQAALGEGQRSDHRRLSGLLSASAFQLRTRIFSVHFGLKGLRTHPLEPRYQRRELD